MVREQGGRSPPGLPCPPAKPLEPREHFVQIGSQRPRLGHGARSQRPAHLPSPHPAPHAVCPAQGPSHLLWGDPQPVHGKLLPASHNSPRQVPLTPTKVIS